MLQIRTYLDKSNINGIGVFADENIKTGSLVWRFNPNIDKILNDKDTFSTVEKEFIKKYAYFDKQLNTWILSSDNDKFTNHSDTPNTIPISNGDVIACKNIKQGEEITINYFEIDNFANQKL